MSESKCLKCGNKTYRFRSLCFKCRNKKKQHPYYGEYHPKKVKAIARRHKMLSRRIGEISISTKPS